MTTTFGHRQRRLLAVPHGALMRIADVVDVAYAGEATTNYILRADRRAAMRRCMKSLVEKGRYQMLDVDVWKRL